jgi:hypothetical protein
VIYNLIGRITVKFALMGLRTTVKPRTAAIVAGGAVIGITAVGAVAVAGYLATREVPEA